METFEQGNEQLTKEQKKILNQLWQNYKTYEVSPEEVVHKVITEQER